MIDKRMNPHDFTDEDYIDFVIATLKQLTATVDARIHPECVGSMTDDTFTCFEPDAETLWREAETQLNSIGGMPDNLIFDKSFSRHNVFALQRWSGSRKPATWGANLIALLWANSNCLIPLSYRVFDENTDQKTINNCFARMLMQAHCQGFSPKLVFFDTWSSSIENLRLIRSLGWHFLTRLESNRMVNPDREGLRALSEICIPAGGRVVWLQGFGFIKAFRLTDKHGDTEHWASSIIETAEKLDGLPDGAAD